MSHHGYDVSWIDRKTQKGILIRAINDPKRLLPLHHSFEFENERSHGCRQCDAPQHVAWVFKVNAYPVHGRVQQLAGILDIDDPFPIENAGDVNCDIESGSLVLEPKEILQTTLLLVTLLVGSTFLIILLYGIAVTSLLSKISGLDTLEINSLRKRNTQIIKE